ncbi:hypothetical protein [Falsirhodobacter deserti]|uniref:hypothetical protein n=1 Tax=Falsirhodobacter deserti TaxID=1365611 RepID=UPI000FE413E9|nr:hypothetical protein [Falsirhodobacter deserti]
MTEAEADLIISKGSTGCGTPYLTVEEVKELLPFLEARNLFVPASEIVAFDLDGRNHMDMRLSLLGMDEVFDWESYEDCVRCRDIFHSTLAAMNRPGIRYECQLWFDDMGAPCIV